ncbi:hypothetical protein Droror1_Dr00024099 [Drosera rotundifolia]
MSELALWRLVVLGSLWLCLFKSEVFSAWCSFLWRDWKLGIIGGLVSWCWNRCGLELVMHVFVLPLFGVQVGSFVLVRAPLRRLMVSLFEVVEAMGFRDLDVELLVVRWNESQLAVELVGHLGFV